MEQWSTVGEVEQYTKIPERTLRRYLNIHGHHIKTKRQGRSVLISSESVKVIQDIRSWYDAGWASDRVEDALAQSGLPVIVEISGHQMAMTPTEALQSLQSSMSEAMTAMANQMEQLRQEVAATTEQNRQLKDTIENKLEERDKLLMQTLRELQETRKRGFWRGLFNR